MRCFCGEAVTKGRVRTCVLWIWWMRLACRLVLINIFETAFLKIIGLLLNHRQFLLLKLESLRSFMEDECHGGGGAAI